MSEANLKPRIQEDMKTAMRAQDKERLNAIRLILAAIKQREVDDRIVLDDAMVLSILDKMVKQRRDSISQFEAAGRQELADKESFEITVIQQYLPTPLTSAEVDDLIHEAIKSTHAQSVQDMGKVMGQIKAKIQGRADAGAVSARIKELLSSV